MKKSNKARLNKTLVDEAVYLGKGRQQWVIWDSELKGFGLRVYPSGRKSFVIGFRLGGRWRTFVLGDYGILTVDEARKRAKKKMADVLDGEDPLVKRKEESKGDTVSKLCADYIESVKSEKSTWRQDERRIEKIIVPQIGSKRIKDITRDHVTKIHKGLTDSPYQANRVIALISAIFRFAKKKGYVKPEYINPAQGVERYRELSRDKFLKPEELPLLAAAIEAEESVYVRSAIWLLLLCGCRKSELLQARWSEVDLERKELRIEHSKAGRLHFIKLNQKALETLQSVPRLLGNPHIFPGDGGTGHLINLNKPWSRIRDRAQEAWMKEYQTTGPYSTLRLHDLRRTFGSWLASEGHSLHLIGKLLDHSVAQTTMIYSRFLDDPQRQAVEEHGGKIISLLQKAKEKAEKKVS